jgi:predicted flap endonuclease-1-like 5' DNA nuclease
MGSTSGSDIFGGITFVVIVVLAVAAIAVMIYGRYLKQRRLAGEKDLIERREAAHVDVVVIEPDASAEQGEPATADIIEDEPVTAPPAAKAGAASKPRVIPKAAAAARAEAPPTAKVAPKAKAAPKAAAVKTEVASKAGVAKAKAPAKTEAAPPVEAAPETRAVPAPRAATKVKAMPKAEAAPAAEAEPAAAPVPAPADGDITQLKGLGPKLAGTLAELGYTRLDQIAALTPAQASELDAKLGAFQGRMARDRWIEQATLLVAGDRAGYEAAFGKLG